MQGNSLTGAYGWRVAALCCSFAALSACVSGDPTLNLTSVENQQPVSKPVMAVLGNPDRTVTPVAVSDPGEPIVYSGVGVPVQAPRSTPAPSTEVAAVPEAQPLSVVPQSDQTNVAGKVIELADKTENQTTQSESGSIQAEKTSEQGKLEVASVSPTIAGASEVETIPQNDVKKTGLLQRLFGNSKASNKPGKTNSSPRNGRNENGAVRVANAHNLAKRVEPARPVLKTTVRKRTATSASMGSDLPGVKSNAEIFGINEAEIKDDLDANLETRVAALGGFGRLSPNGLRVQHAKVQVACLKPQVIRLLKMVERRYGSKPIITSGYRSPKRNRRAGGVRNSQHIFCKAVDIQVEGVSKWDLAKYLRTLPGRGGVGTYCRTKSVHIDVGSRRDWHHPCRRSKVKKRKRA
ncbi:MAG: YcbK family protein [Rhizobiaceae bacterium]